MKNSEVRNFLCKIYRNPFNIPKSGVIEIEDSSESLKAIDQQESYTSGSPFKTPTLTSLPLTRNEISISDDSTAKIQLSE